ncbi:MAG: LysR family transcriptional regulator, partial [Selenomonas sp.]|nr:LysR family transcriptional regulator [Selenomonas sp.]
EGLGYAISFDQLINNTGTELCTRPLEPPIYTEPSIAWKKNQVFSKASRLFLQTLQEQFTIQ